MKIECILKRRGGTFASVGGVTYHFKPQPDGRHVAEVTDPAHIGRFLSIVEGYRLAEDVAAESEAVETPDAEASPYDGLERDELVNLYIEKFGEKPPARIRREAIVNALKEA